LGEETTLLADFTVAVEFAEPVLANDCEGGK
jgi:hypothetical protein